METLKCNEVKKPNLKGAPASKPFRYLFY